MATNLSNLPDSEFRSLEQEIDRHSGLNQVITWAAGKPKDHVHLQVVLEVIAQDEFTHDVIVPYKDLFLVYDTT